MWNFFNNFFINCFWEIVGVNSYFLHSYTLVLLYPGPTLLYHVLFWLDPAPHCPGHILPYITLPYHIIHHPYPIFPYPTLPCPTLVGPSLPCSPYKDLTLPCLTLPSPHPISLKTKAQIQSISAQSILKTHMTHKISSISNFRVMNIIGTSLQPPSIKKFYFKIFLDSFFFNIQKLT